MLTLNNERMFSNILNCPNFVLFQLEEALRKALTGNPSNVNATFSHNLAYEEDTGNGSIEATSNNQI